MSRIVYQTNKNAGTKYAYLSESYRDPKTGTPKSRRTYLGRVDPETGDIIPKAARGGRNTTPTGEAELEALRSAVACAGALITREASSLLEGTNAG